MEKGPAAKIKLNKTTTPLSDILEKSIRSAQSLADTNKIGIVSDDLERALTPDSSEPDPQESTFDSTASRSADSERRAKKTERRSLRAERRWLDAEGRPMRRQIPPEGERRGLDGDRRGSDRRDEDRPGELFQDEKPRSGESPRPESKKEGGLSLNVDADKTMLVIGNLLGNAIKTSKSGDTIKVETRNIGEWFEISVSSTGYYESTSPQQDAAVGLTIAKAIAEAHGGTIGVDTKAKGSTFWFRLPSSCLQ